MKRLLPYLVLLCACAALAPMRAQTPAERYAGVQERLASGWNTWDTRSVLTHVFLPQGFAVDLNLLDGGGNRASRFRIGDRAENAPVLQPGAHAYDGSYTDITVKWRGHILRVESSAEGTGNVIRITPLPGNRGGGVLAVVPKTLWQRGNNVTVADSASFTLAARDNSVVVPSFVTGRFVGRNGSELRYSLDSTVTVCCGGRLTPAQVEAKLRQGAERLDAGKRGRFGSVSDHYNALQTILAWNNIYDPGTRKVMTPVSRIWSSDWFASSDFGGFTLFCWDAYFAALMFSAGNRELAYANAAEITLALTESGFVPNCYYSNGFRSRDRSQPPVGSMAVWALYRRFGEKWFLELLYDKLLSWNRWWNDNRRYGGLLCLGSTPYPKVTYFRSEYDAGTRYGAILESGLDNSPMYDAATFNDGTHLLEQNDVGISSLYVMDCEYLSLMAKELGYRRDYKELQARAQLYRRNLAQLWDEERGLYYNRSTRDMSLSRRASPTSFYPLLAKAPDRRQAERMLKEHLLNPEEFWGTYVIPSVPRNDPAFGDNEYWRGRIWAPLNFLVYLGLRQYGFSEAAHALAVKSGQLIMGPWLSHGYIYENYNAVTGEGDDVLRSDKFYHWGALLSYIMLLDEGKADIDAFIYGDNGGKK